MYGSSFCIDTFRPCRSRIQPIAADVSPLPRDDTTPPVTKMYLVIGVGSSLWSGRTQPVQERVVVGARLDAPRIALGIEHVHRDVVLEEAQLLEALGFGEPAGRQAGHAQQRLAEKAVDADVAQQREVAVLHVRDRSA